MVRRTKADALATRHLILDAAERVFLARGVAHTRLQDVAAEAKVTRGAIYWHFADKAELFNAMMERALLPCEGAAERALAIAGDDPLAQLKEMSVAPLRAMADSEQVQRVFRIAMHQTEYTDELAPVQARYLEGSVEFRQQLSDVLRRAHHQGLLKPGLSLPVTALGLFALVDGLMHHWTLRPGGFDLVSSGETTIAAFIDGIRRPGAALPAATAKVVPISAAAKRRAGSTPMPRAPGPRKPGKA